MAGKIFQFKQFSLAQDRCAMKVGTDGVLLGAWANVEDKKSVLDIGTGTGLLALMVAQRTGKAEIHAVELDPSAAVQSEDNFKNSPWPERLSAHNCDIDQFISEKKFDLILSNPPYFKEGTPSPQKERGIARHNNKLTLEKLFENATRLSTPNAVLSIVYPFDQRSDLLQNAIAAHWFVQRSANVLPAPGKAPVRILIEFSKHVQSPVRSEQIIIRNEDQKYHPDYISLTREFHTIF